MNLLAWLGLADPCEMNDSSVNADTRRWLDTDREARAEVSAREQLAAAQCREAAARYELRQFHRMYGRASATIGAQRAIMSQLRVDKAMLTRHPAVTQAAMATPVDEQRGADEALVEAMQRHPSGTQVDPADTAKVGDAGPTVAERAQAGGQSCDETYGGFICTRAPRHAGQHVAGTWTRVAEVWPHADAVLVAKAQHLGDEIGPGRDAAIEGAAITLRAHVYSPMHRDTACCCGWDAVQGNHSHTAPQGEAREAMHARHVAEQLAAVGALAGTGGHPAPRPAVRTGSFRLGPARGLADGTE